MTLMLTTAGATRVAARTMAVLLLSSSCAEASDGDTCGYRTAGSA